MKTLEAARLEVKAQLDVGVTCPCCGKHAQQYRRKFNAEMSRSLIWLVRRYKAAHTWVDVPNEAPRWLLRTKQLSTVAWWGLIVRAPNTDPKKKHGGLWQPTKRGIEFARGRVLIPASVTTYNGAVVGFSEERIHIEDAIGERFDYGEMMKGGSR